MKNHHISEAGVSFEIQFGLWINIWAGEHIFYIWQKIIALTIATRLTAPTRTLRIRIFVSVFIFMYSWEDLHFHL